MASPEKEIVVDDPAAPEESSPPAAGARTVDIVVSLLLLALAGLLAWDNWRTGIGWDVAGPKPGYFPFYLSLILAGACLWGIAKELRGRHQPDEPFVSRAQLRRVMQVFGPTVLFCVLTQWLGIYVASLLLIAGFMRFIGRIAWWKSLITAFAFSAIMFVTFDVAFDVIMPKGPIEAWLGR